MRALFITIFATLLLHAESPYENWENFECYAEFGMSCEDASEEYDTHGDDIDSEDDSEDEEGMEVKLNLYDKA